MVYLPHLDYNLQRHGLNFNIISKDLSEIDTVVKQLAEYYDKQDATIILLSEYGITNVDNPVHLNRILRKEGYINIRVERGLELLDAGASKAFAVADHQIAHVYLNEPSIKQKVKSLLEKVDGVEKVLSDDEIEEVQLDHNRCGDLVVLADKDSWFTYYFWLDDNRAPDFARMVDIHKKPGYDPVEMLTDPKDPFVMPKVIAKLVKKKLGFRTVLDIIPLDAKLVKGSHGRIPEDVDDYPIFITNAKTLEVSEKMEAVQVFNMLENHVLGGQ